MKSKNVVITGGCGFIGSNLASVLAKGNRVTILENFHVGKMKNVSGLLKDKKVRLVRGNVGDLKSLGRVFKNTDYVFHLAAFSSIAENWDKHIQANKTNISGTMNVLKAAVDNKVKKVVFASSSAVYGNPLKIPIPENSPTNPISPYGAAKLIGEHYCRIFMETYGIPTVSLRFFNVYGPRQDPKSPYAAVIPKFVSQCMENKPLTIFGDGEQTRDFIYVRDVVDLTIRAAETKKCDGEALNVGCGQEISVNRLGKLVSEVMGIKFRAKHLPPKPGDIKRSIADVRKMKRLLKFRPKYGLKEGLSETIISIKKSGKGLG